MVSEPRTKASAALGNWLDDYSAPAGVGDLYRDAPEPVRQRWRAIASGLAAISDNDPSALQDLAARHIAELGLTFRVTGEDEERAWPLTPIPVTIGATEWEGIEKGLIQRARLLEELAADIYGPQRLVNEGHLPAAVIAGSAYFARKMLGRGPESGHFIHVYAADLARGPQGGWRVLKDRVRLATGIGYALENRLAMVRSTDTLPSDNHVRRKAEFYARLREGIAADCTREQPRIALLTPGRFNQTYAEQAHLARYLGLPLVEGRDLSVLEDKLYVGTIAGPKRIDALWRWVNTNALDPLSFDARSQLGVANLFDAWVAGGLEVVNWPGVEVLESPAFSAFLPRLCSFLLGERPLLPTVATWWCGQAAEAATVQRRLGELALLPAFDEPVEMLPSAAPVAGRSFEGEARAALVEAIGRRPMDYCGQEIVHLSTTPTVVDGRVVARPFTVRVFVARGADGTWSVMPGGFARISMSDDLPTSLIGEGDVSADVWVVDEEAPASPPPGLLTQEPPITRGTGILASQAADNLYWFGRYNERAELTVRIVRSILGSSMEVDSGFAQKGDAKRALGDLLVMWGAITPDTAKRPYPVLCGKALSEDTLPGGVTTLLRRRMDVGLGLRERFSRDFWRIVSRPTDVVEIHLPQNLLSRAKRLTEHFSALAGLVSENMVRGPAWCFLGIGKRIERALGTCRIVAQLIEQDGGFDALGTLLDLCDSQIIYRARYLTGPMRNPAIDLVVLDPSNPRSLAFQLCALVEELAALPTIREDGLPEEPLRQARTLSAALEEVRAASVDGAFLHSIEQRLLALSEEISGRYFLQFERDEAIGRSLLG
ncbi:hypothetical protein B2G71_10595 [Novosphingobium sp. PC22D]|uniref:circularly permuted type 2 ATP-grasp protein n=1 Tax=Novosphingobium sp. PC22D TaxID=1962403 RepID=UPI000BFAB509|nr:circularly permuted type 2 ATP-grasp protein [Novosphingobium sp. PC22D]PEQ12740.1 hypothetical protein B2G71_10595 [Novosphingobium sp. PC22D]